MISEISSLGKLTVDGEPRWVFKVGGALKHLLTFIFSDERSVISCEPNVPDSCGDGVRATYFQVGWGWSGGPADLLPP